MNRRKNKVLKAKSIKCKKKEKKRRTLGLVATGKHYKKIKS